MRRLTALMIEIQSVHYELGAGVSLYRANVEYGCKQSSFSESYEFRVNDTNLDDVFRQIKLKVYELEQNENFGKTRRV